MEDIGIENNDTKRLLKSRSKSSFDSYSQFQIDCVYSEKRQTFEMDLRMTLVTKDPPETIY